MESVWFTVGGSNRQYKKDMQKIASAGIESQWLGSVSIGSKRGMVAVEKRHEAKMRELGFSKSRQQPLPR